jgi:diketogulonate reductase-like aldo/keto reductase
MYHNEKETGKAISDFLSSDANTDSLKREDIHFTSKLASNSAYETARKAIKSQGSRSWLHRPVPATFSIWRQASAS